MSGIRRNVNGIETKGRILENKRENRASQRDRETETERNREEREVGRSEMRVRKVTEAEWRGR